MERPIEITSVDKLKEAVESSTGYLIGVTLFKDNKLEHYYFAKDFPEAQMLRSWGKVKELVVEHLTKSEVANG